MSGNTVPVKHEDRWFKDGVDVNVGETMASSVRADWSRRRSMFRPVTSP